MIQKELREHGGFRFSVPELVARDKEIDDRTKSSQVGYNSIDELATKTKIVEAKSLSNQQAIENLEVGQTAKFFSTIADATTYWEQQNTAGNTPAETFKIEIGNPPEYHRFDASVTPQRTVKVGDVLQKADKKVIFNAADFINDRYYNDSGVLTYNASTHYSKNISLDGYDSVTFKSDVFGSSSTVFFGEDGTTVEDVILNTGNVTTIDLTANPDYKYIAVSGSKTRESYVILSEDYSLPIITANQNELFNANMAQFPFSPLISQTSTSYGRRKAAIKNIVLYGVKDPFQLYSLAVIQKNVSDVWSLKVYESLALSGGGFGDLVCQFLIDDDSYTPSSSAQLIDLDEAGGSGITGQILIDWNELNDVDNLTNLQYQTSGIHPSCIKIKGSTQDPADVFGLVVPEKLYLPVGTELFAYKNCIIQNEQKFDESKYSLFVDDSVASSIDEYKDYTVIRAVDNTLSFEFRENDALTLTADDLTVFKTETVDVVTKARATGLTKDGLFITDSYGDNQYGVGMLNAVRNFATDDGNTLNLKGSRTSYGNLGECYAGWKAQDFYTRYVPVASREPVNGDSNSPNMSSPFVFSTDDTPENSYFSFSEYLTTNSIGNLDFIVFFLGMNGGDGTYIDLMVTDIKSALPDVKIIICTIPCAEDRGKNYDTQTRQISREVRNMNYLELFDDRLAEGIYIAPVHMSFHRNYGLIGAQDSRDIQFNEDSFVSPIREVTNHHPTASGNMSLSYVEYNTILYAVI